MQPNTNDVSAAPIPLPQVESDEPVAVIPTASVAPLEGPPDGERINVFTLAPAEGARGRRSGDAMLEDLRVRVLEKPLTSAAVAFALGYAFARILR